MDSGVQFFEQNDLPVRIQKFKKPPFFVWILLKYKVSKNEAQATLVLLGITLVVVAAALYFYYVGTTPKQYDHPSFPEGYLNEPDYLLKYGDWKRI